MMILDIKENELITKTCSKCKTQLDLSNFSKDKHQKSGYRTACKACSSFEFQKFKNTDGYSKRLGKKNKERVIEKIISPKALWAYDAFYNAKARSKKNGWEFNLTMPILLDMAVNVCPLMEIELTYSGSKSHDSSASIDRIDSKLGYTPENCRVISFKANRIKNNASLEEILILAKNLVRYSAKEE